MSLRKSSRIAIRSLLRFRLRTLLTILSLMIGVGTLLAAVAVGTGAEQSIARQVSAAGMNTILVTSGNSSQGLMWNYGEAEAPPDSPLKNPALLLQNTPDTQPGRGPATTLSLEDAYGINGIPGVQQVSASMHESLPVRYGTRTWAPQVRGEQAVLPEIRRAWVFPHGRFFSETEEQTGAAVAVLGSVSADRLFGKRNPVGKTITIASYRLRVIGVVDSGLWMLRPTENDGQFDAVYVPLLTAARILDRDHLDNILVSTSSTGDVEHVRQVIHDELRLRHRLDLDTPSDFTIASESDSAAAKGGRNDVARAIMGNMASLDHVTLTQLGQTLESTGHTMSYLLASIAAVSLVVGGIGIMNIMLLSVTERTKEIGIRRAVGAQSREVMQQFLLESMLLSSSGGALGIALGLLVSAAIAMRLRWSTELSWSVVALSFAVSTVIGVLFGYYPARQAARVEPMTSLRYE
ncbi:MAG TPA: ABC transporter permease [Granulicella sp.]